MSHVDLPEKYKATFNAIIGSLREDKGWLEKLQSSEPFEFNNMIFTPSTVSFDDSMLSLQNNKGQIIVSNKDYNIFVTLRITVKKSDEGKIIFGNTVEYEDQVDKTLKTLFSTSEGSSSNSSSSNSASSSTATPVRVTTASSGVSDPKGLTIGRSYICTLKNGRVISGILIYAVPSLQRNGAYEYKLDDEHSIYNNDIMNAVETVRMEKSIPALLKYLWDYITTITGVSKITLSPDDIDETLKRFEVTHLTPRTSGIKEDEVQDYFRKIDAAINDAQSRSSLQFPIPVTEVKRVMNNKLLYLTGPYIESTPVQILVLGGKYMFTVRNRYDQTTYEHTGVLLEKYLNITKAYYRLGEIKFTLPNIVASIKLEEPRTADDITKILNFFKERVTFLTSSDTRKPKCFLDLSTLEETELTPRKSKLRQVDIINKITEVAPTALADNLKFMECMEEYVRSPSIVKSIPGKMNPIRSLNIDKGNIEALGADPEDKGLGGGRRRKRQRQQKNRITRNKKSRNRRRRQTRK